METSVVFLLGAPIDKNVVDVANNTIQPRQDLGHSPLVQLGCAGDTKLWFPEAIAAVRGDERSLQL